MIYDVCPKGVVHSAGKDNAKVLKNCSEDHPSPGEEDAEILENFSEDFPRRGMAGQTSGEKIIEKTTRSASRPEGR